MNTMDVSNKAKSKHHYEFNMEEECWKDKYHIKEVFFVASCANYFIFLHTLIQVNLH